MSISVSCGNGHKLSAPEKLAGKTVRCPKCGDAVSIPAAVEAVESDEEFVDIEMAAEEDLPPADPFSTDPFSTDPLQGEPLQAGPLQAGPLDSLPLDSQPLDSQPLEAAAVPSVGQQPAVAQPRQRRTAPKKDEKSVWTSLPVLIGAGAGGAFFGFLCLGVVGWLLFGSGSETQQVVVVAPQAPRAAPPSDADGKRPVQPASPEEQPPKAPVEQDTAVAPPVAVASPKPELPASPLDARRIDAGPRLEAFQLPATTWAAAYDEPTGRLAVGNDEQGVVIYDVDYLLAGKPAVVATIETRGLPSAIGHKKLADRRLFLVAGKDRPEVRAIDADSLEEAGKIPLPGAMFADFLYGSPNPDDPFVYYSTESADERGADRRVNPDRLGRINLETMQADGQVGGNITDYIRDVVTSPDGGVLYCRKWTNDMYAATWSDTRDRSGSVVLRRLGVGGAKGSYTPDPFGHVVANGYAVMSPKLWRIVKLAEFEPKAYFRERPLVFGFLPGKLVVGSANDYRVLDAVEVPAADWFPRPSGPVDFRLRPPVLTDENIRFASFSADDTRQLAIAVFRDRLALLPLSRLRLPAEKSLVVRKRPPQQVYVGRELVIDLETEATNVKFEYLASDDEDVQRANRSPVKLVGPEKEPQSDVISIPMAAAINAEQTIMFVNDLRSFAGLQLPLTIQVGDERIKVTGIDTFKQALTLERTNGKYHGVSSPCIVVTDKPESKPPPSLPKIEGRTFRWTPSNDFVGTRTVRLRAQAGRTVHEWYWDLYIEQPMIDVPFYVRGIKLQPGGERAVVWGQSLAPGSSAAKPTAGDKPMLAIMDMGTKKIVRQGEVPRPIMAAVLDDSGVYASLNTMTGENIRNVQPAQILRFGLNDLKIQEQVVNPSHCDRLEVIPGRYLAAFGVMGHSYRLTLPDLKPVQPALPMSRSLRTAGRMGDRWLCDGVIWDKSMTKPQLLQFPVQFGVTPDRSLPRINAGKLGQIMMHTQGPVACTWFEDSQIFHVGYQLQGHPGAATWDRLKLNVYSWANSSKFVGGRDRPPDGSYDLVGAASLAQADAGKGAYITDEADTMYVALQGKLYTVPLSDLIPDDEPFRFDERQSTFVLQAGKSTVVKYSAPGAARYYLQLRMAAPNSFYDDPLLAAESPDGSFAIALDLNDETLLSKILGSVAATDKEQLREYVDKITPAYRDLTGKDPQGVPLPCYVNVVAETAGGSQKAGLAHSYLIEVPRDVVIEKLN